MILFVEEGNVFSWLTHRLVVCVQTGAGTRRLLVWSCMSDFLAHHYLTYMYLIGFGMFKFNLWSMAMLHCLLNLLLKDSINAKQKIIAAHHLL